MKPQNVINHILFVIDASGSMRGIRDETVKVFDAQVKHLAVRSQEMDQETRVTVYLFNHKTECVIYDKDVLRLPSLRDFYHPDGQTALIDATLQAVVELEETPTRYGDHSFLGFVITDGAENASQRKPSVLGEHIKRLPENWTLAVMVPDQIGVHEAKRFGFPSENIAVWDTTSKGGIEEAVRVIRESTDAYMTGRAQGLRGTRSLFQMNTGGLNKNAVRQLEKLTPQEYAILAVSREEEIRPFVERKMRLVYNKGCAFYQMTKAETIQSHKEICIRDRKTGDVYTGRNARDMLGIPHAEVRILPGAHSGYDVFVQSTSVNRKLVPGTSVLVRIIP
jgi:hypothetical protein